MKINSKTFYQNHINEISRYYSVNDSVLHIVNSESNIQVLDEFYETLKIDISSQNDLMEFYDDKKYDLVVITDLFELSDDIYLFLKDISKFINSNGKLLITAINPKWNNFIKVFEVLKLKNSTKKRNYIPPKKINNIAKSTGFEMIHKNTRQIFPFSIFGLGSFINKIFEFLFSLLNMELKHILYLDLKIVQKKKCRKV